MSRVQGHVHWFHQSKGFGFITPDDGSKDVFVLSAAVQASGIRTLADGQRVEFTVINGPKGPSAVNIVII